MNTTTPRYPDVQVALVGEDGNAYAIIGRIAKALRRAGHRDAVDEFISDATSGYYDHLLATAMNWVHVYMTGGTVTLADFDRMRVRVAEAAAEYDAAIAARAELIAAAYGVIPVTEAARRLHLTRGRIYKILKHTNPQHEDGPTQIGRGDTKENH